MRDDGEEPIEEAASTTCICITCGVFTTLCGVIGIFAFSSYIYPPLFLKRDSLILMTCGSLLLVGGFLNTSLPSKKKFTKYTKLNLLQV